MPTIAVDGILECSEARYWDIFFDEEYNKKLFLEVLKFRGYSLLSLKKEEHSIFRKTRMDPPLVGLPRSVAKMIGDSFSYVEVGKLDLLEKRFRFTVIPSLVADKTKTEGELWCESKEGQLYRRGKVKVEVKVAFIGSIVEGKILSDFKSCFDAATTFTNHFAKINR